MSTYTKGGITYKRDSSGKLSRVYKTSKRSSSSRSSSSNNQPNYNEISKQLYGKDYSTLSAGQQRGVLYSYNTAEQRLKASGKTNYSSSDIAKENQRIATEEAINKSNEQKQKEIEARQLETKKKSEQIRNLAIAKEQQQINSMQKTKEQSVNYFKAKTPEAPNYIQTESENSFTPSSAYYERDGIEGFSPVSKQPKFSKEEEIIEEEGKLYLQTTEKAEFKPQTFKDYMGASDEFTKTREKAKNKIKEDLLNFDSSKIGGDVQTGGFNKDKLKLASETPVNRDTYDLVRTNLKESNIFATRFTEIGTTTEQYRDTFVMPDLQKREELFRQANKNLSEFESKEVAEFSGKVLLTAGTVATGGALLGASAGGSALATGIVTTAKVGAGAYTGYSVGKDKAGPKGAIIGAIAGGTVGGVVPTSVATKVLGVAFVGGVALQTARVISGKTIDFQTLQIVNAYEGKPTKRLLEATDIVAEVGGVVLGGAYLKGKQIDPTSYKPDENGQTFSKYNPAKNSNALVKQNPNGVEIITTSNEYKGGYRLTERGTIKTYSGNTRVVQTTYKFKPDGTGTYQTFISKNIGSKPLIVDQGKLEIDYSLFSKSNIKTAKVFNFEDTKVTDIDISNSGDITPNKLPSNVKSIYLGENQQATVVIEPKTSDKLTSLDFEKKFNIEWFKPSSPYYRGNVALKLTSSLTGQTTTGELNLKLQPLATKYTESVKGSGILTKGTDYQVIGRSTFQTYNENPNIFTETTVETASLQTTKQTTGGTLTRNKVQLQLIGQEKYDLIKTQNLINIALGNKQNILFIQPEPVLEQPTLNFQDTKTILEGANLGIGATLNIGQQKTTLYPSSLLFGNKTKQKTIYDTAEEQKSRVNVKMLTIGKPIIDVNRKELIQPIQEDVLEKQATKTSTKQATKIKIDVRTEEPITEVITEEIVKPNINVIIKEEPVIVIPPPIFLPQQNKRKEELVSSYDVFVRKAGKFEKLNQEGLSKGQALDFGAFNVSNTARASFKLMPSSSPITPLRNNEVKGSFMKFKKNFDLKNDVYIEKKGKRIKSIGELREITFKGLLAKKGKGLGIKAIRW